MVSKGRFSMASWQVGRTNVVTGGVGERSLPNLTGAAFHRFSFFNEENEFAVSSFPCSEISELQAPCHTGQAIR